MPLVYSDGAVQPLGREKGTAIFTEAFGPLIYARSLLLNGALAGLERAGCLWGQPGATTLGLCVWGQRQAGGPGAAGPACCGAAAPTVTAGGCESPPSSLRAPG